MLQTAENALDNGRLIGVESETGMVLQFRDGIIQSCDRTAEQLLGKSAKQLVGKTLFDVAEQVIHPDGSVFAPEDYPEISALRSGKPCQNVVMGFYKPSGDLVWLLLNSTPLFQADTTTPYAVVTTLSEVPNLQQKEPRLETNPQAFVILEQMTDAFVALDRDFLIVYANQEVARLNNLPVAEIVGKTHWEMWPWSIGTIVEQNYRIAIAQHQPVHFEVLYEPLMMWLEIHAYPSEAGLGIFFRDITERKQAEQQLRQTLQTLTTLIESSPLPIVVIEPNCITRLWNPAAEKLFGWSEAEVLGQPLPIVPEEKCEECRLVRRSVANGEIFSGIETYRCKRDGTSAMVSISASPLYDEHGHASTILLIFQDVTERQQTEAALRQSEERSQVAQLASKSGIWDWDVSTNKVFWSQEYYQLYGLDATLPSTYENWLATILEADRASTDRAVRQVLEQGQTALNIEFRINHPSQGIKWFACLGQVFYDSANLPTRAIGISLDITDRKRVEEELRQKNAILDVINQSAPTPIFVKDRVGRIIYANPATLEVLGKSAAEVIGKTDRDLYPYPEDADKVMENDRRIMESGQMEVVEESPDGIRTFLAMKAPYRNQAGEVVGLIGISYNISDRKQAELLLIEQKKLLELTASGHPIDECLSSLCASVSKLSPGVRACILLTDSQRLKFPRSITPDFAPSFGQGLKDAPINELAIGTCGTAVYCGKPVTCADIANDDRWSQGWRDLCVAHGILACHSAPVLGVDNLPLGSLMLCFDEARTPTQWEQQLADFGTHIASIVFERDRAGLALRESLRAEQAAREQAEAANRIKDEFLAVLSHELRTPLNPILGWAKLLQTGKMDAAKTAIALQTIERNAKLQAQLIEDLLDISRIMRGKLTLNPTPVNLAFAISAAIETVRLAAEAKSIDFRFTIWDFGSNQPGQISEFVVTNAQASNLKSQSQNPQFLVSGDAGRLQQVVWNLLSNAVKFTPAGGRVEVKLKELKKLQIEDVRLQIEDENPTSNLQSEISNLKSEISYAQIQVIDTGKGINPEFLPYVFEHFRQEDAATTRKFGGLGLGLAIARQIVELHGGRIWVESPGEGQGATFTVELPLLQATNPVEEVSDINLSQSDDLPLSNLRVLVVDDEPDSRDFVAFVVEQAGAKVTAVGSAIAALQIFRNATFDIILSDIGMPQMDGYALMREIRQLPEDLGGKIGAIALTAYAGEIDRQQALNAGFGQHISKPIDSEQLMLAIASLIKSKTT